MTNTAKSGTEDFIRLTNSLVDSGELRVDSAMAERWSVNKKKGGGEGFKFQGDTKFSFLCI